MAALPVCSYTYTYIYINMSTKAYLEFDNNRYMAKTSERTKNYFSPTKRFFYFDFSSNTWLGKDYLANMIYQTRVNPR